MASVSLEHIFMILITVIVVAAVGYAMTGIAKTNSERVSSTAKSTFGKNVEFSIVPNGLIERYATAVNGANNTIAGYEVSVKLTFTKIKNVDANTYFQVAVTDPGAYGWKVSNVTGDNLFSIKDYSGAMKISDIISNYVANSDFSVTLKFFTDKSVVADDEFTFKVQLGDSPARSVTVEVHPPLA